MGSKYRELREQLDSLGYKQKLVPECIPLVQKLLLDLDTTTVSLQKYMKISQRALEEKDLLELGAEPYKCDNGKLIKECNDLHIAFIHFKEQHEKIQRELRYQISTLQTQLDNCNSEKRNLMSQIQLLEKERFRKSSKTNMPSAKSKDTNSLIIDTALASAESQIAELSEKLKDIESEHLKVVEDNAVIKKQLKTRDSEIERLRLLVEGGRPLNAASKDCCYKNIDGQVIVLQDEITRLKRERNDLQMQIKDALAKQHEAMRRALHLAERNQQLEKELKDVDEIALAVETECNNTVKDKSEKVARLQDRINESLILIQTLERENATLKSTKLELSAEMDSVKLEKIRLQKMLENERGEKKNLTDQLNKFTIIENDLNLEIDRLSKLTTEQKRKIVQLESHIIDDNEGEKMEIKEYLDSLGKDGNMSRSKVPSTTEAVTSKHKRTTCKKGSKCKFPTKTRSPTKIDAGSKEDQWDSQKCCCESGNCIKNLKDLLDREVEFRQVHAKQSLEDLRQEKDYYMKEYHRVLEQMRNVPSYEISENGIAQLKQQLRDKDNQIRKLEEEVRQLSSSRPNLLGHDIRDACINPVCKNRERELEIKTRELSHTEIDNNTLKAKLQAVNETTVFNEERMKKAFKDMEEHIRKLEDNRRDLVKADVTNRSNMSQLEEDYRNTRDQLRLVQNELNNQRANYNQLKLLHEQTDRALSEAQAQIIRCEGELSSYKAKMKDPREAREAASQDAELAKLRSDIQIMKNQLTKLDREKDDLLNNLDEKTEKIALLEEDVNSKNKLVSKLENELKELNRKLSKYASETSSQDQIVRSKQQELALLEQDYEKEKRLKEAALQENKRLQNDLSSVSCDCRDARNELDICRRQVEDLKRQLQHYVAEVKRTEDLISNKELERNELLDQFRSLSQEANILESNNHTLETEANQSKIQLSVALDHTSELERKLENQESVIRSYEKQIADLTSHIARMEVQLKQNNMELEQYRSEIKQMRDLCVKLDKDKDNLRNELYTKEDRRLEIQKATEKLNSEKHALECALDEERNNLESVEKLLNEARRDTTEQRLLNEELQREIVRLKQKIEATEERLATTAEQLDTYQVKALEYSQQNKQLRRDIANERFSRARSFYKKEKPKKAPSPTTFQINKNGTSDQSKLRKEVNDVSAFSTRLEGHDIEFGSRELDRQPYVSAMSLYSTNTLEPTNKFHGSDGVVDGAIDLTKLHQNNLDCDEGCDKSQCPLHRKMFFIANNPAPEQNCPNCQKTSFPDKKEKRVLTPKTHYDKSATELAKSVEFDLLEKNNYKLSENDKKKSGELTQACKKFPNMSVTSTKSLTVENYQKLRDTTRAKMNLVGTSTHKSVMEEPKADLDGNVPESSQKNFDNLKIKPLCAGFKQTDARPFNVKRTNLCFYDKCSQNSAQNGDEQALLSLKDPASQHSVHSEYIQAASKNSQEQQQEFCSSKQCNCEKCLSAISVSEPDMLKGKSKEGSTGAIKCRKVTCRDMKPEKLTANSEEVSVKEKPNEQKGKSEVASSFEQDGDTSAVFHKKFTMDGVGLECRCCISSFRLAKE